MTPPDPVPHRAVATLAEARTRLAEPKRRQPVLPLLGASALMALSALTLASAVILGPFWQTRDPPAAISDAVPTGS